MDKQIGEMMRLMCADFGEGCKDCPFRIYPPCQAEAHAEALFEAGYDKQSEAEWEVCSDEYEICASEFVCSSCKESFVSSEMTDEQFFEMMKYCPNCGARMRGENHD